MKKFYKEVDTSSKDAMINFLESHFRYDTMSSWNCSTSYANNVKVYNLGFDSKTLDAAWDMLNMDDVYDDISIAIDDWSYQYDYSWQVGFNGKSGGYLVLYSGGQKSSGYKSYCIECGQRNFTSTEETGNKCGNCGAEARQNYKKPPMKVFTYARKSIDMNEDFDEWTVDELQERVELIQSFDKLCDDVVSIFKGYCTEFEAVEEVITVPKTIKVLKEKAS